MSSTDTAKKRADFLLRYALQSFAIVIILAVLLRTFLISSYVMSGWSMLPSIWPGDFIVAAKVGASRPERGAVVVLRCPNSRDRICLKRVVGVSGDRIEFRAEGLWVNGQPAVYQPVADGVSLEAVAGESWLIWPSLNATKMEPVIVPPGHVFLLNDKRSDQEDSRHWGPVRAEEIEARALRVWLSLDWYDGDRVRTWPRVRWPRLLRSID